MKLYSFVITLFLLPSMVNAAMTKLADEIEPGDGVNEIQLPLTKHSAAELVKVESEGKVLSVDEEKQSSATLFHVKVLHKDGKIKVYSVDASTGLPPNSE